MGSLISQLISLGLFRYLGIAAIGTLIWYTGPSIEFLRPVNTRLIAIAIVVAVYGIYQLVRMLMARRKEKRLADGLASTAKAASAPPKDRSGEEIATLKAKFDEAVQTLRKSGKGKHQGSLYSLPWYMIIGPPGAGKTTLLVNSGLHFPLAEKMGLSKLQGVGGTRFCDWWFTDEAVIVDTAGRYTTQDSDAKVDNAAWIGFLDMLRKNRKRRPINGIIVAISIDDLARQSEVDRERSAIAVTQRIQELYEHLRVRFPVYVMFTKCDLMSGFMEFFGDLDRREREQVWGTTFPIVSDATQHLEEELQLLQQQLQQRLVQRLQQERDPRRRNLIYNFPGLFNSTHGLVAEFIKRIDQPSRFTTRPLLRGIYFTSGTQEGTPFNRLIAQLARNFNLSNASGFAGPTQGKSFFIKDLLSLVIFGESGLAGANLKAERVYSLLRTSGFVALAIVPLALIALWWMSYANNLKMMETLQEADAVTLHEQIAQVSPQNGSLLSVLPTLNAARGLTAGYAAQFEPAPLNRRFGLYQGRRLAKNLTVPAYQKLLENAFLSRLMIRLEQQLKDSLTKPETAYQALKAYLMLGDDERLDAAYLKLWLTTDWESSYGRNLSREQYDELSLHLDALLDLRPFRTPFDLDRNLIEHVRGVLAQTSYAQRAYAMIKSEVLPEGKEFTVTGAAGPDAPQVFIRISGEPLNRGVPHMFSPDGYYQFFIPTQLRVITEQEDEFWIFGTTAATGPELDKTELSNQVSRMYLQDYIDTWWRFLEDVRIRRFSNFTEAAEILRILSGDESPLVALLQGAAEMTSLAPDLPDVAAAPEDNAARGGAMAVIDPVPISAITEPNPGVVNQAFRSLKDFVSANNNSASPISGVKEDIKELYSYVNLLARSGTGASTAGAQQDISTAVNNIRMSASYAPKPMSEWIDELANQSEGLVAGNVKSMLDSRWRSEVAPFCQRAIGNRYPFDAGAESEVSLQDFGEYFGQGGKLEQFFNSNLSEYIDTTSSPWRVRSSAADIIRINAAALQQIQLAREIRQSFFPRGGTTPVLNFELKPVGMDADTTHFMLDIDGQKVKYSHGPLVGESLSWPGSGAFSQVQIQFSPETSLGGSRTENGAWAWFRMLDKANIQAGSGPDQFKLTFTLADRWITFQLRASSAYNPFKLSQLRAIRCVPNL